jgi:ubiquinone/menaquinone biosynthesis C-methylase UbiE
MVTRKEKSCELSNGLQTESSRQSRMRRLEEYPWPRPQGCSDNPIWTGNCFCLGRENVPVLSYERGVSGWTDDLTRFHDDTAGSNHFIDCASRAHALRELVARFSGTSPLILEVGCSSGFLLSMMRERMPQAVVIGADYIRGPMEALAVSLKDVPLLQLDLVRCPLPSNSLDAVVMLNVLEHIEDDREALAQVYRILKPGGLVIIEAPAGPHLYDVYDKLLMHKRRYSRSELCGKITESGFNIMGRSHLGFFLYPGFYLTKKKNKRYLSMSESLQEGIVRRDIRETASTPLFRAVMNVELFIGRWISYPLGIRCLISAEKPEPDKMLT